MQQLGQLGLEQFRLTAVAADLSERDFRAWARALRDAPIGTVTEEDFLAWLEGPLRRVFPFDRFLGAYGGFSGGRIYTRSMLSSGHSSEYLASRDTAFDVKLRGSIAWWMMHRRALILDRTGATDALGVRIPATEREIDDVERFSLGAVACHGIFDPFANNATYVGFSGVPKSRSKQTLALLDLVAPVVQALYFRTKAVAPSAGQLSSLTNRQRDLADLAALGLTDREIAARVGISEHTVGNHFRTIYGKLSISRRCQLIALLK